MLWYVYILLCNSNTYYVGLTHNVEARLKSHKSKENIATKEYYQVELQYTETYKARPTAEKREKQLKGWSVAKKKALISGNIPLLKKLCKP